MPDVRVADLADAPPQRVWAAQLDGPRIAEWFPGARSVRDISGPLDQPGTTYVLRFKSLVRSRVEVTEVEAPVMHTRVWDARPFGTRGRATVLMHQEDGATRVDLDVNYQLPLGPLGRLLESSQWVRHRAAREIRKELQAFCRFAERRTSQEGIDRIRRLYELTYTQDNWASVREAFAAGLHPDLVFHSRADEPDRTTHIGRDAYERSWSAFVEAFPKLTFDLVELTDAGDHVIASTVMHGWGSASGVAVNDPYVFVYKMRNGLAVEGWEYRTKREALAAIGFE